MNTQETLCLMALTRVPRLSLAQAHSLVATLGSATAVWEQRHHLADVLTAARKPTLDALAALDTHMARAEQELEWATRGGVQCLGLTDEAYPQRLRDCPDALVVSGLAYGVDIHAHRAALQEGSDTVAVLAHGLDQIYPRMHRDTAVRMLEQGGLLTEFMSGTNADKRNFVQRNRIVAGVSDVTVVVESACKGGSLITAELASGYGREVAAFPGRVTDECSEGCNALIRTSRAALITSAQDLVDLMGWDTEPERKQRLAQGIQPELFPQLTAQEQQVLDALRGSERVHLNHLAQVTSMPVGTLSSTLFGLEMKGLVRMLAGGMYRLA